ncbi:MAG: EAL domain-containing protein [Roseiarcus sp.]
MDLVGGILSGRDRGGNKVRSHRSPDESNLAALSKLESIRLKVMERKLPPTIATLGVRVRRLETVIDNLSHGVCYFDAEERLILSNRRYAEIYRLDPTDIRPGATTTEIVELRAAAGTTTMATDAYLATARAIQSKDVPGTWINELTDGRAIQVYYRPVPDGGWVATHEDITELKATRTVANERLSLQTLIDWVPDYLWVKDATSRFVVANKAITSDSGRANTCDMIGLTDFDIHAPEAARKFRVIEEDILRSGQPMIDREELIVNSSGAKKWLLTTKVPLRNDLNETIGLVGISRDITELQATRTLANERVTMQALIDFLPDNLWVKDVNGRFVICNKVTASRMGYQSSADLIGKTDLELLSPDIAEKFFADEQTIVRTGQPMIDMEESVFGVSGEKTWILTTKVPLRNDQNDIFGVAGVSRDTTARKRLAAETEYRSGLLHAVSIAAKELLTASAVESTMATVLKVVGEAARADRMLVFEMQPPQGRASPIKLRYAWHSARVPVIVDAAAIAAIAPETFPPLEEGQARGAALSDLPDGAAKALFLKLGIRSKLVVPITVDGKIWGRIGLDDCTTERAWSSTEIDILRTVADMIGCAIIRERYVDKLKDANTIVESSPTVLFRLRGDPSLPLIYISHNVTMYGYEPAAMIASPRFYQTIIHPDDALRVMELLTQMATKGSKPAKDEFRMRAKDGAYYWLECRYTPVRDAAGRLLEIEGLLTDITERKKAADEISVLAMTDALTGLANRAVFIDRLCQAFAAAKRGAPPFAILYLDLDGFKDINDTLGHSAGDLLLKSVGERLKNWVRETDLVARLGGDEFAILQTNRGDVASADVLASKIHKALSAPYPFGDTEMRITVSIGISPYMSETVGPDEMLAQADIALYRAKDEGRNQYCFHTDDLDREAHERLTLADDLRQACQREGELELYFQPQIEVATGLIVSMEALIRWNHPKRGLLQPSDFLPNIEATPTILTLGQWVLEHACGQMSDWRQARIAPSNLALNLSLKQLQTGEGLVGAVTQTLTKWGLSPKDLELDVTESMLAHVTLHKNGVLDRLHQLGVRIAIDDFGTQYSSFDYLKTYCVSRVKIPGSMIDAATHDPEASAMVRAIMALGRELGIDVVAQGVETEQQRDLLNSAPSPTKVQGFYYGAPVPAAEATELLRQRFVEPRLSEVFRKGAA